MTYMTSANEPSVALGAFFQHRVEKSLMNDKVLRKSTYSPLP